MELTEPVALGARTAPSRVLFGPHVTNLARGRALSGGHAAYYGARAAGGAGAVVVESASVHESDHPYERAPLAAACAGGWARIGDACRPHGTLVLAGLGHAGAQGSSAYHQRVLWAPSPVPDPGSREVPWAMEAPELAALVDGFAGATVAAADAGLDGVEVQAGPHALLRQFLSGLTNHRNDAYGADRTRLLREVLAAVRDALGPDRVLGLRLGVDELAPWAGITPPSGAPIAASVAGWVDYVVPVRGSGLAAAATRPDAHTAPGFGVPLARAVSSSLPAGGPAVVLAGSVVDATDAQAALDAGVADLVEMTRAQIADPGLVAALRAGRRPRPCVLTNQRCRVRDVRNPEVSCTVEPDASAPVALPTPFLARDVLVVGAGPAGLEGARVLAAAGHRVRLVDRAARPGGMLPGVARLPGRARFAMLAEHLVGAARDAGVEIVSGVVVTPADIDAADAVLVATGAVDRPRSGTVPVAALLDRARGDTDTACQRRHAADTGCPERHTLDPARGPVLVDDPLGDGVGVAAAEMLAGQGAEVVLVTPDPVVAKETADPVGAHGRLRRAGVRVLAHAAVVAVEPGRAVLRDVDTGVRTVLECGTVVDAGPRRASEPLGADRPGLVRAGDAVAPRTVHEAVREGRRAAEALS